MAKIWMVEETGNPLDPATGSWVMYFKSDGFYIKDDTGTVTGPIVNMEIASVAEINAGTNNTKAITPDGLAGSELGLKAFACEVFTYDTPIVTGDGAFFIPIEQALDGMNLVRVQAQVYDDSTSGSIQIQLARGRRASAGVD